VRRRDRTSKKHSRARELVLRKIPEQIRWND